MKIEVNKAVTGDAPTVHSLVQAAFVEYRGVVMPPTEAENETLDEVIEDVEAGVVLVAWRDGVAVGSARYELRPDCLYARRIAVPPEHRGQGVADALMLKLEEIASSLGRTKVSLSTRRSLPRNLAFYRRLGYKVTKEEPHRKGYDWSVWFEKVV